jgi:HK97 family phage prohead protease
MKAIEYKGADLMGDVLDVDMENKTVKTVWARFNNVDLDNDIIVPEAVTKTIKERGPKGKNLIWSLVDHCANMTSVIGKPSELFVKDDMLIAVTKIIETEIGEDMIKLYNANLINQHSIGFSTIKSDWQDQKQTIRIIKELKLYEGSAVLWGANPETPTLSLTKAKNPIMLQSRLEALNAAKKSGTFTDETFSLMEIEIKQIESTLAAINAPEPNYDLEIKTQLELLKLKFI